ncbi:MAG: Hsp20 family protein [Phycisphaera sp.]|nr:Hsp20 family protein [Phycisphaera sp.]
MLKTARSEDFDQHSHQLGHVLNQLWQWHYSDFCPAEAWTPSINVYTLPTRIEICVDLAGVDRTKLEVHVKPGQLMVRGVRQPPEPSHQPDQPMRIVNMEINHGPFCRTIPLPDRVDLTRVASEYVHGLLWVRLPLRPEG